VIIRADGSRGGYEEWLLTASGFPKLNSVSTIVLEKRDDADDDTLLEAIERAELIFLAGGDQWDYLRILSGSRLGTTIERVVNELGVPVAGTSAGMAVLAGLDYTARYGSPDDPSRNLSARDVLRHPLHRNVDLSRDFLIPRFLGNVVTDTHFTQRNREGRLLGFLARALHEAPAGTAPEDIRGIGADEETAVCFGKSGKAQVHGRGRATFLSGNAPIERIEKGRALHWYAEGQAIKASIIPGNDSQSYFDLESWTPHGGTQEYWFVNGTNPDHPVFGRTPR
jgi:cyanophycinase